MVDWEADYYCLITLFSTPMRTHTYTCTHPYAQHTAPGPYFLVNTTHPVNHDATPNILTPLSSSPTISSTPLFFLRYEARSLFSPRLYRFHTLLTIFLFFCLFSVLYPCPVGGWKRLFFQGGLFLYICFGRGSEKYNSLFWLRIFR